MFAKCEQKPSSNPIKLPKFTQIAAKNHPARQKCPLCRNRLCVWRQWQLLISILLFPFSSFALFTFFLIIFDKDLRPSCRPMRSHDKLAICTQTSGIECGAWWENPARLVSFNSLDRMVFFGGVVFEERIQIRWSILVGNGGAWVVYGVGFEQLFKCFRDNLGLNRVIQRDFNLVVNKNFKI